MKYLDEFRDPQLARNILTEINRTATRPWVIMEVCGGQTHSILRHGIDQLLPAGIELVHGPGCPVCVTPLELIDTAIAIANNPNVILASFGDMLRVPGSQTNLLTAKSRGADVRIVYSPLDAVALARENQQREIVFFAVGFETTAPTTALAVYQAAQEGLTNFFLLVSHVLVPPAMMALLNSPSNRVQAYLAAGHVCTVMGWQAYESLAQRYRVPVVVTGFEPVDILDGVLAAVRQLESGMAEVENRYPRAVTQLGNVSAQEMIDKIFEPVDRAWRGIGVIPASGLRLRHEYARFDAERRFNVDHITTPQQSECISGEMLQGLKKPTDCPAFGKRCTPQTPLGATMVSSEGACAAYFAYQRHSVKR